MQLAISMDTETSNCINTCTVLRVQSRIFSGITPRLVINYKPLNEALQWIQYPISNKRDLLNRLYEACIFSKFDIKSGYWQIQIAEADKAIVFAKKFRDEITDKQQLQRFLGSLNYLADFYKDLAKDAKPLFARLKKSPGSWTQDCTKAVHKIKSKAKELSCLAIPHPDAFKIVETDVSELGYGGEAAILSSTKRVSADSASSNLKRMDDGYKRTTRTLAFFIEAEHWGSKLELIGCARITHFYKSNKPISYSKMIILDVFSNQDWGDNLFSKQKFKDSRVNPNSYNFFDYNINYGHSWFIKLAITTKDFSRVPIPYWFQQWLLNYGIVGDAIPELVIEASNKSYQHNQKKAPIKLSFLYFLALYQVPWILRWEYQFNEDPFSLEAEKSMIYPFTVTAEGIESNIKGRSIKEKIFKKEKFLLSLKEEIKYKQFQKQLEESVCSDVPNAFWSRQKHTVCLPYVNGFDERKVSTKERPI
ncbi:hypothetical protein ACOSP7_026851 [Xanthoceras sorbifolium]